MIDFFDQCGLSTIPMSLWFHLTQKNEIPAKLGGPGSGHHGHQSKIGHRGGSVSSKDIVYREIEGDVDFNKLVKESGFEEKIGHWLRYRTLDETLELSEEDAYIVQSVRSYLGTGYRVVNSLLRGKIVEDDSTYGSVGEIEDTIDDIDFLFEEASELPEPIVVFRGFKSGDTQQNFLSKPPESFVGQTLEDKGFLSTTWQRSFAEGWAMSGTGGEAVVFKVNIPKKTKFIPILHKSEKEIIFDRGSKVLVRGFTEEHRVGYRIVTYEVDLLPPDPDRFSRRDVLILKLGGPGSGHHGHQSKIGHRGGSVASKTVISNRGVPKAQGSEEIALTNSIKIRDGLEKHTYLELKRAGLKVTSYDKEQDAKRWPKNAAYALLEDRFKIVDYSTATQERVMIENAEIRKITNVLNNWVSDSSPINPNSLRIHAVAVRVLGSSANEHFRKAKDDYQSNPLKTQDALDSLYSYSAFGSYGLRIDEISDSRLDEIVIQVYNNTQTWLSNNGIKPDDEVVLYRGIAARSEFIEGLKKKSVVEVKGNPLESWSLEKRVATKFSKGVSQYKGMEDRTPLVVKTVVKASQIISGPRTGFGALGEYEILLLGDSNQAEVVSIGKKR